MIDKFNLSRITKLIVTFLVLSPMLFSQVVIKDSVKITPKKIKVSSLSQTSSVPEYNVGCTWYAISVKSGITTIVLHVGSVDTTLKEKDLFYSGQFGVSNILHTTNLSEVVTLTISTVVGLTPPTVEYVTTLNPSPTVGSSTALYLHYDPAVWGPSETTTFFGVVNFARVIYPAPTITVTVFSSDPTQTESPFFVNPQNMPTFTFSETHVANSPSEPTITWNRDPQLLASEFYNPVNNTFFIPEYAQSYASFQNGTTDELLLQVSAQAENEWGIAYGGTPIVLQLLPIVDHFDMQVNPAEIEHGGTSIVRAIAIDLNGTEVNWKFPLETPVMITADPDGFGHFEFSVQAGRTIATKNPKENNTDSTPVNNSDSGVLPSTKRNALIKDEVIPHKTTIAAKSNVKKLTKESALSSIGSSNAISTPFECTYWDLNNGLQYIADGIESDTSVTIRFTVTAIEKPSATGKDSVAITKGFDHFEVKLEPDTLSNRDITSLTVIAVDINGTEVSFNTSTPMELSFDEGQEYIDFISTTNDTVNILSNVFYSTLRSSEIKVIARGESGVLPALATMKLKSNTENKKMINSSSTEGFRTDYPKAIVKATMMNDATKVGRKNEYLRPEIKVIAVADSIKPNYPTRRDIIPAIESQTEVKVAVTVSGLLYSGPPFRIEISSKAVDSSGGHSHTGNRPTGRFIGNGEQLTLQKETNGDTIRQIYQASLFGGKEKVFARLMDLTPVISDSDSVVVRISNLQLLPGSANYTQVGGTCEHHGPSDRDISENCQTTNNNHFGTVGLNESIEAIANEYHQTYPLLPILAINDMSLQLGGRFDKNGNWEGSHAEHRVGHNADIRSSTMTGDLYRDENTNGIYDEGDVLTMDRNNNEEFDNGSLFAFINIVTRNHASAVFEYDDDTPEHWHVTSTR